MSALLSPWRSPVSLGYYSLILLAALLGVTAGRQRNCTHPLVPEHGGFRCMPSPCRGFPQKSSVHYFCEPGYHIPGRAAHSSRCRHGHWIPSAPACVAMQEGRVHHEDRAAHSIPSVATTAVAVSIFLLTTTACMVIKSRLYPCHSHRRSSDQMELMVDGFPVSLPTYEEAVYGNWGQRLPPCRGPTQLLLAQEAPPPDQDPSSSVRNQSGSDCCTHPSSNQGPGLPPPPYEEIQSSLPRERPGEGDVHALRAALSNDKDV